MFGFGNLLTSLVNPSFLGVVSLVAQGVGTMMQLQAQKQALAYQQMQARLQEKQYQQEAEAYALEVRQKELDRRNLYNSQLSENRALMAASGIDLDSPSYRAFLKKNEQVMREDVQTLRDMSLEARLSALYNKQQAQLSAQAAKVNYRTGVLGTLTSTASNLYDLGREFTVPASSLLPTDTDTK